MTRILILLASLFLVGSEPARSDQSDDLVMTEKVREILRDHLDFQRVIDIFLNCLDRPTCEFFMSTVGAKKYRVDKQTPFEIDRYIPNSFEGSIFGVYSLYYNKDGVDVGDTLTIIDAAVNSFHVEASKGAKTLVENSFAKVDASGGALFWLGKLYITDGVWLKAMIHQGSSAENDYTLRFLVSFTDDRSSISGLADALNRYFFDAVSVYSVTDQLSLRSAILAVGKVAASLQRESMLEYLALQIESLRNEGNEYWMEVINNLQQIHDELASREWTMEDIVEEKALLRRLDPELADALDNSDGLVFRRLYPELFLGKSLDVYALPSCPSSEFFDNCFSTQTFADGEKYVGEWKDNRQHGQGTYTFADGTKYVGEWNDGKMHGQGTFAFADGRKYVGEFKDNLGHGEGVLTHPDGTEFIGEFKFDNYSNGTQYAPDGTIEKVWRDGVLQ